MGCLLAMLAGAAAAEVPLVPQPVAWFTDNGDRAPVQALRDRPEASLGELERAILEAANRTGWIEVPECNLGSNAFLIEVDGRDAVVTSRHLIAGKWMGDRFCDAGAAAVYYPNYAYVQPEGGEDIAEDALFATVPLEPDPVNAEETGFFMAPEEDWLVYFLTEQISDQPMPEGAFGAGSPRGTVPFARARAMRGEVVVVGIDGRFSDTFGEQYSWQTCRYVRAAPMTPDLMYIDCDVSPGASSSLLGSLEGGSLAFQGLVTAQMDDLSGNDVPVPQSRLLWNMGTSVAAVEAGLEKAARD